MASRPGAVCIERDVGIDIKALISVGVFKDLIRNSRSFSS